MKTINPINLKCEAYMNLHKKCFSIRHKGRVIEHAKTVVLVNAQLFVQPAGREKCRVEGRKNVHAGVRGQVVAVDENIGKHWQDKELIPISYDPYTMESFQRLDGGTIEEYEAVLLCPGGAFLLKEKSK